jgi:hypothetical protein
VTVSLRSKANVPLSVTLPTTLPVVPPLPSWIEPVQVQYRRNRDAELALNAVVEPACSVPEATFVAPL